MSKARIYRGKIDPRVIEELERLLAQIGCEEIGENTDDVEDSDTADEPDGNAVGELDDDGSQGADEEIPPAFLVILEENCAADPDLDPAIAAAVARGERVIGIWPQTGAAATVMPKSFPDVGCDTVAWDPIRIRPSIDGIPQHQAPDGNPAKRPETPTNAC